MLNHDYVYKYNNIKYINECYSKNVFNCNIKQL
jgi:hypothetical protein